MNLFKTRPYTISKEKADTLHAKVTSKSQMRDIHTCYVQMNILAMQHHIVEVHIG